MYIFSRTISSSCKCFTSHNTQGWLTRGAQGTPPSRRLDMLGCLWEIRRPSALEGTYGALHILSLHTFPSQKSKAEGAVMMRICKQDYRGGHHKSITLKEGTHVCHRPRERDGAHSRKDDRKDGLTLCGEKHRQAC